MSVMKHRLLSINNNAAFCLASAAPASFVSASQLPLKGGKITAVSAVVRVKEQRSCAKSSVGQLVIDVSAITVHKIRAQFRHTVPADTRTTTAVGRRKWADVHCSVCKCDGRCEKMLDLSRTSAECGACSR